jgi:hypothetical protein
VFAVVGDPAGGVDNAPTSEWLVAFLVIGAVGAALLLSGDRGDTTVRRRRTASSPGCCSA